MKKKSQIRKYSVEKVSQLSKSETIPEMLKLYAEHAQQKKDKLQAKKDDLINQLNSVRKQSQKIAYQMVDGVKDRIEKTEKIVMSAQSRPTPDDIKSLSDLFAYMENQSSLIHRNSEQTKKLYNLITGIDQRTIHQATDYTDLDNKFAALQAQCQKQQIERDRLLKQRNDNRQFYQSIGQTIGQYRTKYDIVQAMIAERQKYLDHLVSYFNTRQAEDKEKIENEERVTNQLESEMLRAQEQYNNKSGKKNQLEIRENQYSFRKDEGM